jgi:hypothetical protein
MVWLHRAQGDTQTVISPRDPNYSLEPLELKIGETLKRTVKPESALSQSASTAFTVSERRFT